MHRTGMALKDLLIGVVVVGSLSAIAVPTLSQVRMDASRQACNGNYKFIAQMSASYTNDFAGYMWAASWQRGMLNPAAPFTSYFGSDAEAQATQTVLTLRRLGNLNAQQAPIPTSWMSQILYSHVALLDYVNLPAPASFMVCPEDWTRQAFLEGDFSKLPDSGGDGSSTSWRWPFSSSYSVSSYHWGPSRQTRVSTPTGGTMPVPMWYATSANTSFWTVDGNTTVSGALGPRLADAVRFPASKVFMSDEYARHNGRVRYYAYPTAAQDMLFYDGSVRYYRTDSTNPGWDPSSASRRGSMTSRFAHTKKADVFGTLDNNVAQANFQAGWYRWTRGGLFGWDVPRMSSMVGKPPAPGVVENEVNTNSSTGAW